MYRYRLALARHPRLTASLIGFAVLVVASIWLALAAQANRQHITDFNGCIAAGYDASDSDPQTCTDGHTTWAAKPAPTPKPTGPSGTSQQYQILVSGDARTNYPAGSKVITNQADWQSYWSEVHVGISPTPPLLPVDFTTQMVLAINLGPRPTTGYGLEFSGFTVADTTATASYEVISPAANCMEADHVTSPYLMIATTKTNAVVNFVATNKQTACSQ